MKGWFTFLVDGEKIAFFAHSSMEAEEMLRRTYPYAKSVEFIGLHVGSRLTLPDTYSYEGLSFIDHMKVSGVLRMMETFAKGTN